MSEAHAVAPATVVVSAFDGFHRGHVELMATASSLAARESSRLVAIVLDDPSLDPCLSEPAARADRALQLGAHSAHVLAMSELHCPDVAVRAAHRVLEIASPGQLVVPCSSDEPAPSSVPAAMVAELANRGVAVVEVGRVRGDRGEESSSAVRVHLCNGDVEAASEMLGRRPTLTGVVVRGQELGRTIGFATANLEPSNRVAVPAPGVYAALARHEGTHHMAAVNIGCRPTVQADGRETVEAHLLDFEGDLYGQTLELEFHERLRDEERFADLDGLVRQLHADVAATRAALASEGQTIVQGGSGS